MSPNNARGDYGLIRIQDPPVGFPHIHIILVHGIGGDSRKTWTLQAGGKSFFWPEWLQNDRVLRTARVSAFSYNAAKKFWKPHRQSIAEPEGFAHELLMCLANRDENVSGKCASLSLVTLWESKEYWWY